MLAFGVLSLPAAAVDASAAQTRTVKAKSVVLPKGDHTAGSALVPRPMEARRIPIGFTALKALKAVRAPAEASAVAPSGLRSPAGLGISANCATNVATGFAPSDIHGAAGHSRIAVVTNVDIGIYSYACAIQSRVPLKTFFAALAPTATETLFDPRVLYDRKIARFFVTVESRDSANTNQFQYIAVSKDSSGSSWWVYKFALSSGASRFCKSATNSFWDYPNAGYSANRWYITANDFPAAGGATGAILSIDKIPSLSGGNITAKCFSGLAFNQAPPIVLDQTTAATTAVILSPGSGSGSAITRRDVLANGSVSGSAAGDTLVVRPNYLITAWTAAPDAPQPNGQLLDSLDGRFQSNSVQSRGQIWNVHAVNSGGRGAARWYRLGFTTTASNVLQNSTFLSDVATGHYFNPSIGTGSGIGGSPAFINVSRTTATPVSGNAAQIMLFGPNNTTSDWVYNTIATSTAMFSTASGTSCNASSRGSCRWGDYSSVSIDPNYYNMAWGFNQLINGSTQFNWFTRGARVYMNLLQAPDASN